MPTSLKRLGRGIERLVGSDVHEGEWRLVLLFSVNLFLLLTAYYILKVIREPLILVSGGAVSRSYARGLQAGLLFLAIPLYSALANRYEPARLVKWILGLFVLCLALFFVMGRAGAPIGFAFFVWLGIFSTVSTAQFWSLANDVMTAFEGKRLFPMIAAGGTIGGILGAQIAARTIHWFRPDQLMLMAAGLLGVCMILTHRSHGAGLGHRERLADCPPEKRDPRGGFTLLLQDRYLLLIAISVLVLNFVNTTGDFLLAQMVDAKAQALVGGSRHRFIGAFYGDFQTWVSTLTAIVQIVVVGRVFKSWGIGSAMLILPLVAVTGYGATALIPLLTVLATVKVIENSTDYSLQNTIQQALFLPTSRDAKYKAKSAVDTVAVRTGDLLSTAVVFAGAQMHFSTPMFAFANVLAGLALVWVALQIRRRHRALVAVAPGARPLAGSNLRKSRGATREWMATQNSSPLENPERQEYAPPAGTGGSRS